MAATRDEEAGGRALIFVGPDYEDLEVWYPRLRFLEAGLRVTVAGLGERRYTGKRGYPIEVDADVAALRDAMFDVVVVPGGWAPDKLRMDDDVLHIIRRHMEQEAVVAVICHGGWVLASAGVLKGRRVTGYRAIRDDLVHAGATFLDEEVVVDGNLVTSRNPHDLPAFCRQVLRLVAARGVPVAAPVR